MDDDLLLKLKALRLYGLIQNFDHYGKLWQDGNDSFVKIITGIIDDEFNAKKERSIRMRLRLAKIPEDYVMETFPFAKQPNLPKKKILNLYDSLDFMTKKQGIIFMGPTGAGKSSLAQSFLIHAINQGHNGLFIVFPDLIDALKKAIAAYSEDKALKKFWAYDCLLIDEMGYTETDSAQVGLFFRLMQMRHKKKTTLITTNLGFSEWGTFLKNDALTVALIDRLTETHHVINMKKCISIRPVLTQHPRV